MRLNHFRGILKTAVHAATVLLLGVGVAKAQQQINLTAGPTTATMPDGSVVPMWGYSCGAAVAGSTASCRAANANAIGWSPVIISLPAGESLTINLTNNLPVAPGASSGIPTSLVIVGQLGGGLGTVGSGCTGGATCTDSPDHTNAQSTVTWPIPGGAGVAAPAQGKRVQSFSTEVATGATTALTWTNPRAGTYLLESGTHPSIQVPMGLIGALVVTTAPSGTTPGTAYPGVSYNADVPLIFSEIDPVQNVAVKTAVGTAGFSETMVWSGLAPNGCGYKGSPTYNQCYPPVVNYKPLYYLINGVAFDKTNSNGSLFATTPSTGIPQGTGKVLVRLVNAGARMHIPSIVGSMTGTPQTGGFSLIAEDGNLLPGIPRVQSEIFMPAGKTNDVMINAPVAASVTAAPLALPIFDRELSLAGNATERDAGMLAYISVDNGGIPASPELGAATAHPDVYASVLQGQTLTISDPGKGVIANDENIYGVQVQASATPPAHGAVQLNADGTFSYVPNGDWSTAGTVDHFSYCGNGAHAGTLCTTVTLSAAPIEGATGITLGTNTFTANAATYIKVPAPGLLTGAVDAAGYPLKIVVASTTMGGASLFVPDTAGGFTAVVSGSGPQTINYTVTNTQGSTKSGTATVMFPTANGPAVTVLDGKDKATKITDYRWIIEEDRTLFVDPSTTANNGTNIVPTLGTNFHTSYMPVIATGCTGPLSCESGQSFIDPLTGKDVGAVCDQGNGVCRQDMAGAGEAEVDPSQVHLDPARRYYISILPGDAANAFEAGNLSASCAVTNGVSSCGHGMGGAPVAAACQIVPPATSCTGPEPAITIYTQPNPYPPSKLSVFVFEDDFPLNGEQDGGGGVDVLSPNEAGLGGFNITLMDDAGGSGDATGQVDYDMFNQPLSNSLAGVKDPSTGFDACPISKQATNDPKQTGITGQIVTCPKYESDGKTLSPLAGQAVVANMMPGRYGVIATPAADRIAAGEEWLQTNTLDGQKAHDSFLRIGEPSYFQEYGPAGYHVSIGFANPAIINARRAGVCNGTDSTITGQNCTNTISGLVTTERNSRTPDERLYSSGSNDSFGFTQCYVSFGDPDGEDFAFTKCAPDGTFKLINLPDGDWRVTVFDQWNDMLVDGLSTPIRLNHANPNSGNMGEIAINQWQANISTNTFFDANKNGVRDSNEQGLSLVPTNVRYRDGSFSNFNSTDLNGNAGFNEEFPLFAWYVVETDSTRYKNTGTHVVYDAGGPADGTACGTRSPTGAPTAPCGNSNIAHFLANTAETISVPTELRVPGAVYCKDADCTGKSIADGPASSDSPSVCTTDANGTTTCSTQLSTGRIDPAWVTAEGWQGFAGQNNFLEFGKTPYSAGENGGIRGHVVYASTRPFDDPQMLLQLSWEPLVPNVTINLYKEGSAPDGTTSLTLVDTTKTSSWDDWAQGFRSDGSPNMNCPGQGTSTGVTPDLFYFSLYNQPDWLDTYNASHNGTATHPLPYNSQFKCYDGLHNWNQLQPAPYDGMYKFPSIVDRNPQTGVPQGTGTAVNGKPGSLTGTNCTICVADPTDGSPMLPVGKYVVEVVVPPGYELVKEEDKNILIGDNFIAPATVQFPGLGGSIFILPDQATIADATNPSNPQNSTTDLGRTTLPSTESDTGEVEIFWPCVGTPRVVPDYISLFPGSKEVAPFAGATRNLCDRKEVTLNDQESALAKFYVFTSTHTAAHFTGIITDDYTSEFDPFSPQFGEKFSPPDLPVAFKDWTGLEIARVYADHWGAYNGLTFSTWEVNPPNPTGYSPQMMITCMNDPGTGATPDPLFNPQYSQFCYEIPFMPGQTQYMDTPVVPTSAFAGAGYNNPDCAYPDATPAVSEVDGDGVGPWVSAAGHTLTIKALGDLQVPNNAYSGPQQTASPYNQKKITRHYGFGGTQGTVTIGGINASVNSWSDTQIVVQVPSFVPDCTKQQQLQYGGPAASDPKAQCGELVITAASGKQSVDTVTVTIGGKAPTVLATGQTIQNAIDQAAPGDLIIVPPGQYQEMVLMWKPVRLQGVGAASSILNANTQPAGKIDDWRRRVDCLFGLALDGTPVSATNPYDPSGTFTCGANMNYFTPTANNPQIDRLPLEATVGWDASLNGNLAELLQEPTLMGALEGAGITVLSKGVNFPSNPFASDTFPTGTQLLTGTANPTYGCGANTAKAHNPFPSNFLCNPSSIDGMGITDSSQGGGGIFVHAWGHYLEIANNRIYNNAGTLSGGINIGQGEHPGSYLSGAANAGTNAAPGSCEVNNNVTGLVLPYCFNTHINIHHNAIVANSSTGDELFSATPAGAGGVSMCTGADYYNFNYNWVCGNLSSGDGGGFGHIGFSKNGDIEHNSFLFNQSTNPTIPTNGGGVLVMGAPDVDPTCGAANDLDCVDNPANITPSDGSGPGLVINANLIMGNSAESGSGGGLRLQNVNGTDVTTFPTQTAHWNTVSVTNNIITNNVAGWDGAGISLLDALNVNIINNTIASNDTTGSAGVLFNTLGAPLASSNGPCGANNNYFNGTPCVTSSTAQPAGLVSIQNSAILVANLPSTVNCPGGHGNGGTGAGGLVNGNCRQVSVPELYNNVFWQNRAYHIGVGNLGTGLINQQNVVALYVGNSTTPAPSQPQTAATSANGAGTLITGGTGACLPGVAYWDIGVRGDTGPTNHDSTVTLNPLYSVMTDATGYSNTNTTANPTFVSQYCNGSRVPPELGTMGYQVPPGISDATVPNPIFNLTPAATVDEGNNWINISWGPLALTTPAGTALGNYSPASSSAAINLVPASATGPYNAAPAMDFFGNTRKTAGDPAVDAGAVEYAGAVSVPAVSSISPNVGGRGRAVPVVISGSNLNTVTAIVVSGAGVTVSNITPAADGNSVSATFTITSGAAITARDVTVHTPGGTAVLSAAFTVAPPSISAINPASGMRGATVPVTVTGFDLTDATGLTAAGLTVTNFTVVNDTTITASLVIPAGAATTPRNVAVQTPDGNATGLTFAVTAAAAPALAGVNPLSALHGSSFPVVFTGNNLAGATAVTVSGAGVTCSISGTPTATTVNANCVASSSAVNTTRTIRVRTSGGLSNTLNFTIRRPTISSISPATGKRGTTVPVTMSGTDLMGVNAITVSGLGVSCTVAGTPSDTSVNANCTIASTAGANARAITLSTGTSGSSNTLGGAFTVTK